MKRLLAVLLAVLVALIAVGNPSAQPPPCEHAAHFCATAEENGQTATTPIEEQRWETVQLVEVGGSQEQSEQENARIIEIGKIEKRKPLWTLNLKRHGFGTFRRGLVNDYGSFSSIAFTKDVVAVAFDRRPPLIRFGNPRLDANPRPIVVLACEARTGKQLQLKMWPNASPHFFDFFAARSGELILKTQDYVADSSRLFIGPPTLTVLSPDLEEVQTLHLPRSPQSGFGDYWQSLHSPSGNSLYLAHKQGNVYTNFFLAAHSLEIQSSWTDEESVLSVSDQEVLRRGEGGIILIRSYDTPWRAIQTVEGFLRYSRFLSNELIIATAEGGQFAVTKRTGEKVSAAELRIDGETPQILPAAPAANGRRFAAVAILAKPVWYSKHILTAHAFVFVWNADSYDPIFATRIDWSGVQGPAIALAPDGSLLAVVSKGTLMVYELPELPR